MRVVRDYFRKPRSQNGFTASEQANGYHITLYGSRVKTLSCPKTMSQILHSGLRSLYRIGSQRLYECMLPHVQR
jgi:hypothetical protein